MSKKGVKMSAESKRKMSEARMGKLNHMHGKKHSEETKRKISKNLPNSKGELHNCCKLTEIKVLEIRAAYAKGGVSQKDLAEKYGVTQAHISRIIKRQMWKHV